VVTIDALLASTVGGLGTIHHHQNSTPIQLHWQWLLKQQQGRHLSWQAKYVESSGWLLDTIKPTFPDCIVKTAQNHWDISGLCLFRKSQLDPLTVASQALFIKQCAQGAAAIIAQ
jgi:hypothetical protein